MTQLFLEAKERREALRDYGRQYRMRVFIETGTHRGDTPWFLKHNFEQLYTIELDDALYEAAVERFRDAPQVTCLHGDSTEQLPHALTLFEGPALVWLDGHHSGPGTAHGKLDTPIVQELETLFADGRKHVILIDDARIFEGQPEHFDYPHYADYPSCEWVEELAKSHGYDYELVDDIMRLTPAK